MVSIQSSYTSPSKCICFSLFGNHMSCSLYSLNCLFCGDVIYVCLATYTTISIVITIVGNTDGSTLPFIIFYALKSMLSYCLFTLEPKAPPSSTLLFLLRTFFGESTTTFFVFFSVVYISSLVLLTLTDGFCGLPF
jgi:hypothetical protein